MLKGDRREQKRRKAWYKRHQKNNRKALEVIIEVQRQRIRNASEQTTGNDN